MRALLTNMPLCHVGAEGDLASIRLGRPWRHRLPQRTLKSLPRRDGAAGDLASQRWQRPAQRALRSLSSWLAMTQGDLANGRAARRVGASLILSTPQTTARTACAAAMRSSPRGRSAG